jgi:hypothetical protein
MLLMSGTLFLVSLVRYSPSLDSLLRSGLMRMLRVGLSLLAHPGLERVDPIYCMPLKVTEKLLKKKASTHP